MAGAVISDLLAALKYWEISADNLSAKAGGLRGWVSATDPRNALISRTFNRAGDPACVARPASLRLSRKERIKKWKVTFDEPERLYCWGSFCCRLLRRRFNPKHLVVVLWLPSRFHFTSPRQYAEPRHYRVGPVSKLLTTTLKCVASTECSNSAHSRQ